MHIEIKQKLKRDLNTTHSRLLPTSFIFLLLLLGGCSSSMPKHLEYGMQEGKSNVITVIDERLTEEKFFRERIDSKLSYFYGDDSFDVPLIAILRNRLASKHPLKENLVEITINRIILAASINEARIDKQAYNAVSNQIINNHGRSAGDISDIFAKPIIGAIEQSRSRRSIWCHIDYKINGKEYSEKEVSSAKSGQLSEEIVLLYMEAIDNIAMRLPTKL